MSEILKIRPAGETQWDCAAFGEVMLRLDPGEGASHGARSSRSGKAAANTMWRAACAASVAAPPSSPRSRTTTWAGWLEDLIFQGGVDTEHIKWVPFDGIGRSHARRPEFHRARFRRARRRWAVSDRGHTAASQIKTGDSTGTASSARTACAGSTPAASSPR